MKACILNVQQPGLWVELGAAVSIACADHSLSE
jgi:hypothetical protein